MSRLAAAGPGRDGAGPGPLLEVTGLKRHFAARGGIFAKGGAPVRAVDGVSFSIGPGEALGLVGESGCGKTTVKTSCASSEPRGSSASDGVRSPPFRRPTPADAPRMQFVLQDPASSLVRGMTVGGTVGEPLRVHGLARGRLLGERIAALLRQVGLPPSAVNAYPHEFSGGQRQRIGIARALALGPEFLVLDEPVSALDVSIQAQIITLIEDLQEERNLSYLFISHDLRVVEQIADRVAVMYLGLLVEEAGRDALYERPLHPYTQALIAAVPEVGKAARRNRGGIRGEPASPSAPPPGCRCQPRCRAGCGRPERPPRRRTEPRTPGACWLTDDDRRGGDRRGGKRGCAGVGAAAGAAAAAAGACGGRARGIAPARQISLRERLNVQSSIPP